MMRVPIMESVNKWKNHFERMARGQINSNSVRRIKTQTGRGAVGSNYRGNKKIFTIQSGGGSASVSDGPNISPVTGALDQTKSELKNRKRVIKGTVRKRSVSRKKGTRRSNTKKVKKSKPRKKTVAKKKSAPKKKTATKGKRGTKRKKNTKSKTVAKRSRKDIFVCKQK